MEEQFYTPEQPTEAARPEGYPSLPVNITREEFVAFSLLQARIIGVLRRRKAIIPLSLCLFAAMAGLLIWDFVEYGTVDIPSLVATVFMLLPILLSYGIIPVILRKKAEKSYDDRQARHADKMYGLLTVYPDRVEKVGTFSTAKIPLHGHTLFVERQDMLLFLNRLSPALVLPARCMTPEMTAVVKAAADKLPTTNRVFISRFQPLGQPVTPPPARPEEETLWEQMIVYTPEESYRVTKPVIVQRFWKMAPMVAGISLLGAYMLGWDGSGNIIPCILYFLVCMAVLTLLFLVTPLSRMKKMVPLQETKDLTVHLRITEKLVYFRTAASGEVGVFWEDIDHVYDKDDMVEIEYKGGGLLFIPKRFIVDLQKFDEIIRKCRENAKQ
ncbi:MAG: hypothetical protein IJ518_04740 [Clostridia bacterium]|nr:hypothetical protein [Clostridia bacterium]